MDPGFIGCRGARRGRWRDRRIGAARRRRRGPARSGEVDGSGMVYNASRFDVGQRKNGDSSRFSSRQAPNIESRAASSSVTGAAVDGHSRAYRGGVDCTRCVRFTAHGYQRSVSTASSSCRRCPVYDKKHKNLKSKALLCKGFPRSVGGAVRRSRSECAHDCGGVGSAPRPPSGE